MPLNFLRSLKDLSKFSFGATSAITTSLALIVGLDTVSNPKMSIISALLLLAFADNISDSLGIHVYRESESSESKSPKVYTISNFLTRLIITLMFVLLVALLPLNYAIIASLVIGLLILTILSYLIAVQQNVHPLPAILHHLGVAVIVLATSHFIGKLIVSSFRI